MDRVDGSEHFEKPSHEQSPSLLTIILDTNPAAWSLLSDRLPLSSAVANLLVFINAHLASNYTNKVAVIASHCDKAQWLYPSAREQHAPRQKRSKRPTEDDKSEHQDTLSEPTKRLRLSGSHQNGTLDKTTVPASSSSSGNKYRPFRLVEEELISNLTTLLTSTSPSSLQNSTSTMIAGALTLALSYINRETIAYTESLTGSTAYVDQTSNQTNPSEQSSTTSLQSRILLISASPSTDLAHQYIPIMNAIFACQRLSIPIDILQLPIPSSTSSSPDSTGSSTVFLQQAADATKGIFIPARLTSNNTSNPKSTASTSFLTYLLTSLLPSPSTRRHLILPTRIDVDFRAACFCHRRIIDTGFVCSICLSIFCSPPENGDCLTCGTHLTLGEYGGKPVVVPKKKKKRRRDGAGGLDGGSGVGTPTA